MDRTTKDLAWLAGLLEGEGSFTDSRGSVSIQVTMTDSDIIERAAAILGVDTRKSWQPKGNRKRVYGCYVLGPRAVGWMMTLYQFFGERRQRRIREIIETWRGKKYRPRLQGKHRLPAVCHPDKPRSAGLLCFKCRHAEYMREWRKNGRNGTYYRQRKLTAA
jgi:hypothetical protein